MKTTPGDIIVLNMSIKNYDVRFLRYEVGRRAIKLHMFEISHRISKYSLNFQMKATNNFNAQVFFID